MKSNKILTIILGTSILLSACGNQNATTTEPVTEDKAQTEVVEPETTETPADTSTEKDTATDNTDKATDNADNTATDGVKLGDTEIVDGIPQVKLSMDDALDKYFEHFGDDTIDITEIQLDFDNNKFKYEIEGYKDQTEYDVDIDANTGEVTESKTDTDEDSDTPIDIENVIKPEEAMKKALEGQDGAYVKEWSLEVDGGETVYDFDIENGNDKKVNAITGDVWDD